MAPKSTAQFVHLIAFHCTFNIWTWIFAFNWIAWARPYARIQSNLRLIHVSCWSFHNYHSDFPFAIRSLFICLFLWFNNFMYMNLISLKFCIDAVGSCCAVHGADIRHLKCPMLAAILQLHRIWIFKVAVERGTHYSFAIPQLVVELLWISANANSNSGVHK